MILPEAIHILQPAACGLGSLGAAACQPGAAASLEDTGALQAGTQPAASVDDAPWFRAETCAEVLALNERGIDSRAIFTEVCGWTKEEVLAVLGKCRIFTGSWEDLLVIDSAAKLYHKRGFLEMIGLVIMPETYCAAAASGDAGSPSSGGNVAEVRSPGENVAGSRLPGGNAAGSRSPGGVNPRSFPETEIAQLSAKLRKLGGISINGCVINAPFAEFTETMAAEYFQNCYQTAKRMTTTLPCTLSYIYMPGSLPMLQKLSGPAFDKAFTAASTFAMQNETAFFARIAAD
ncbi:MAG: hypothetical protein K6G50_03555 [bacterium]|nr:hypothetical protein [bacterium]